ncbi:MAG: HEAT repeat domain-containing protein [Planctomycetes bacterium]|nr:HEAT repeat domain-containing protein [Planctomycetota bacterium]
MNARTHTLVLTAAALLLAACGSTSGNQESPYAKANSIVAQEIDTRIGQIPFQHREELYNNLLWLSQQGEPVIPYAIRGLRHSEPKMRASCAWILGRIGDRRTIQDLQAVQSDDQEPVRLEVARSRVLMGDMKAVPTLIQALDSDKTQVRALCHEALKSATGRDFGYDHLTENLTARQQAVLAWRKWWSAQSNDPFFASNYEERMQASTPAAPSGEVRTQPANPGTGEGPGSTETTGTTEPQGGTTRPDGGSTTRPTPMPEPKGGDGNEPR